MTIHWSLLASLPVPPAGTPAWLGPTERQTLAALRIPKRRADWLLGRLRGEDASSRASFPKSSRIERPLDAFDIVVELSGAPLVRLAEGGKRLPVGVSISHSEGMAFSAAWAETGDGLSAGADLERIAPREAGLVRDFFRPHEIDAWGALSPGGDRDIFATAVWSAKEAVLKALRVGLAVDTLSVGIILSESEATGLPGLPRPDGGGWKGFEALVSPGVPGGDRPLAGFWREDAGFVLTLAISGPKRETRSRRAA